MIDQLRCKNMDMEKKQLRSVLQEKLKGMSEKDRADKSKRACRNLISSPEFRDNSNKVVMLYLSMPEEIDTSEAILHAWQMGKTVLVPRVYWEHGHMLAIRIHSLDSGFSTGISGLRNPIDGQPIPFEEIDLVVAPGLGFDLKGNRLGRGGAYYDRFLRSHNFKAKKCGFAFDEQVLDSVPITETDVPMDLLVTDKKVLYFEDEKGEL